MERGILFDTRFLISFWRNELNPKFWGQIEGFKVWKTKRFLFGLGDVIGHALTEEHELLSCSHYLYLLFIAQGEFFMVQDVNSRADVLNTRGSYGAPNFRKVKETHPLFGMGQASMNGFKQLLQRLESEAYEVSLSYARWKTFNFCCVQDLSVMSPISMFSSFEVSLNWTNKNAVCTVNPTCVWWTKQSVLKKWQQAFQMGEAS